jgi:hypothetical protein
MVELMKNNHSNDRFTLVAENIAFQNLLNSIADSLKTKRPAMHVGPFLVTLAYKIDWFLSNVLGQKRKLDRSTAKASYTKNHYSNEKIKTALQTEFLDIHQYIKDISKL